MNLTGDWTEFSAATENLLMAPVFFGKNPTHTNHMERLNTRAIIQKILSFGEVHHATNF